MIHIYTPSVQCPFKSSIVNITMDDNIYYRLTHRMFSWFCSKVCVYIFIGNCVSDVSYSNLIHSFSTTSCCIIKYLPSSSYWKNDYALDKYTHYLILKFD